jgi:hypothetical protein
MKEHRALRPQFFKYAVINRIFCFLFGHEWSLNDVNTCSRCLKKAGGLPIFKNPTACPPSKPPQLFFFGGGGGGGFWKDGKLLLCFTDVG